MLKYNGKANTKIQTVVGEVEVDKFGLVKDLSKEQEEVLSNGFNFEKAEESKKQETEAKGTSTKAKENKETDKSKETSKPKTSTRRTTRKATTKKDESK